MNSSPRSRFLMLFASLGMREASPGSPVLVSHPLPCIWGQPCHCHASRLLGWQEVLETGGGVCRGHGATEEGNTSTKFLQCNYFPTPSRFFRLPVPLLYLRKSRCKIIKPFLPFSIVPMKKNPRARHLRGRPSRKGASRRCDISTRPRQGGASLSHREPQQRGSVV